jgi:hypothetical protein
LRIHANPNVVNVGGFQSQGVKGDVVVLYFKSLTTQNLKFSGVPDVLARSSKSEVQRVNNMAKLFPLICLTSDIDSRYRWRGTLTELDQDALFQSLTVYTNTPVHGSDLPQTFREAYKGAVSGAMGASHIGMALNVQEAETDDDVYINRRYGRYSAFRQAPDSWGVAQAAQHRKSPR